VRDVNEAYVSVFAKNLDFDRQSLIACRRINAGLIAYYATVEQGRISDMLGGSFGTPVPRFMGKDNNTIFVDGVNGSDGGGGGNFSGAINADAIQEISVQMNSYSAQYARGGGPQINIVSKSGGQQYHGTLYWFKRTGWYQQLKVVNKERMADIQTHVLNVSYVIDLPRGSNLIPGAVGRAIFDNWQVSGVTTFASGKPLDVTLATTDNFDFSGGGESCGVVVTGPAILPGGERTVNRWFNTSVFKRPSGPGDLGNDCSNYRGPGINNWDVSFFNNFPVGEGKKFQLRWEMYNVFKHTQLCR
jgi:hypothetical protein